MDGRKLVLFCVICGMAVPVLGQALPELPLRVSISTRTGGDWLDPDSGILREWPQGPSQSDVAMQILLEDQGVRARVLGDKIFADVFGHLSIVTDETGQEVEVPVDLVIFSGSSGSSDVPDSGPMFELGIPIMCGEHVCLAQVGRRGDIKMYIGSDSHTDWRTNTLRRIKIVDPNHPITQGIPTDADGYVTIFREPFPNEGTFKVAGEPDWLDGHKIWPRNGLYDTRVALGSVSLKAPGTQILAELDPDELAAVGKDPDLRVVLAVVDEGGQLADGAPAPARLVHWIINDEGSGGPGRNFLALNETGRALFIRAAMWAMGQEVPTGIPHFSLYDN